MTGVTSPLATNPTGVTAIMGYEPNLQVFAGFDLARHRRFTTGSPSVQIDIDILRRALSDGLAFDRKTNDEIACGIRPDHVLAYLLTADRLHRYGRADYGLLVTAAAGVTLPKKEMKNISEPRRRTVQEVSSWSRDARFRNLVLQAYDRRCAITGLQLRLVDAAHILPVGAPGSTDHVNNGIALSPTYHRAYDRDLIYLDENYHARLNERKLDELRSLGLSQGIEQFREPLNRQIILPAVTGFRPSIEFIRQANALRRAAG
jgi:putative restriction endonuclease